MRVVRRGAPTLEFQLFAPNDKLVLEQISVWASAYSMFDRSNWIELVIERPDPQPPGFVRVVVHGPFDAPPPRPALIADIRLN